MSSSVLDVVNGIGNFLGKVKDVVTQVWSAALPWISQAWTTYPKTSSFAVGFVAGVVARHWL